MEDGRLVAFAAEVERDGECDNTGDTVRVSWSTQLCACAHDEAGGLLGVPLTLMRLTRRVESEL